MRFLRRPRDVAKRTQLSGIYVCVCVSGLCVTFYVGYPSVIYDFRYIFWKRVRVLVGVYILNSTKHFPNQRCVVLLI